VSPRDAVIDLDVPAAGAPTPRRPVRSRRRIMSAAVLAFALLAPAAAAAPATPPLVLTRTVWVVNGASGQPVGDTLYVAQLRPERRVTAYPLAAGPPRWSTVVPVLAGIILFEEIADLVLVSTTDPGTQRSDTVALDRRTGAVRWERPMRLRALDPGRGRVLLGESTRAERADLAPAVDLVSVRAATGVRVWTYHHDDGCLSDTPSPVGDPRAGMAVLCGSALSVVDLDTGRVRATRQVPVTSLVPGSIFGIGIAAFDDRLLVSAPALGRSVLTAFGYDDLRLQWTADLDLGNYGIASCGRLLCLFSTPHALAVDRADGTVIWRLRAGGSVAPLDDRHVLIEQAVRDTTQVVDTVTGTTVLWLAGWAPTRYRPGAPIFYRYDVPGRRLFVAALDPGGLGLRVLGSVPEPDGDVFGCVTVGRYLVCRTVKDAVKVWRIAVSG